jgi:hypothetical protein
MLTTGPSERLTERLDRRRGVLYHVSDRFAREVEFGRFVLTPRFALLKSPAYDYAKIRKQCVHTH